MAEKSATIEKISTLAPDTFEVTFKILQPFSFIAGQYITVTLPSLQNLPNKEQSHDFSIASQPEDQRYIAIALRNSSSNFKTELLCNDKNIEVLINGPKGIFTLPKESTISIVFIAGGIGITPFLSMIRHIVISKIPLKPTLFYYNHSRVTAPYLSELERYRDSINFFPVFDKITEKEVAVYLQTHKGENLWYLAGPRGLVKKAREILTKLKIDKRYIKSEEFSGYE